MQKLILFSSRACGKETKYTKYDWDFFWDFFFNFFYHICQSQRAAFFRKIKKK